MSKEDKRQKELERILARYEEITLDLEASTVMNEIEFNTRKLKNNNKAFEIQVSGGGTGKPLT